MLASNIPVKMPVVWASGAPGGDVHQVPTLSQIGITNGAASFTDGFPPLNFLPVASGGVPPFGQDFNGILQQITAWNQWEQLGGPVPFDGTFTSGIAGLGTPGYPRGASIAGTLGTGNVVPGAYWISLSDGNTANPDLTGSLGGSGWSALFGLNGTATVNVSGNSDVTLTPAQYAYNTIVCTGTLTGNINLNFPALPGRWTVQHKAAGGFQITCRVPGGGSSIPIVGFQNSMNTPIISDGVNCVTHSYIWLGNGFLGVGSSGQPVLNNNSDESFTFVSGVPAAIGSNTGSFTSAQFLVQDQATGTTSCQRINYLSMAPNNTASIFLTGDDTSGIRFQIYSNGGLANFSANNVNLSDADVKMDILPYTNEQLDTLEEAFCAVDWGTYKYKDQTHDDPNHGYTAQGVRRAFMKAAPELVDTWGDGKQLAVYDNDLTHIGHALLAKALRDLSDIKKVIHAS